MTRAALLEVVYRFYPRGVLPYDRMHVPPGEPVYDDTDEHRRLVEAAHRGRAEYARWQALIDRLGDRYDLQNESLHLLAGGTVPAYSARIYLPDLSRREETVSFHVSLLGPYYGVHHLGERDEPADIAREIEVAYPGYTPIPPEIGNEVLPDVEGNSMWPGTNTIYVCLFSEVWTWGGMRGQPGS
jgi:hypothetical protein